MKVSFFFVYLLVASLTQCSLGISYLDKVNAMLDEPEIPSCAQALLKEQLTPTVDSIERLMKAVGALTLKPITYEIATNVSTVLEQIGDAVKCLSALQKKVIAKSQIECSAIETAVLPNELQAFVVAVVRANDIILSDAAGSFTDITETIFASSSDDNKVTMGSVEGALKNVSMLLGFFVATIGETIKHKHILSAEDMKDALQDGLKIDVIKQFISFHLDASLQIQRNDEL